MSSTNMIKMIELVLDRTADGETAMSIDWGASGVDIVLPKNELKCVGSLMQIRVPHARHGRPVAAVETHCS